MYEQLTLFIENEQGKSAVQDAPMFVAIDFAQSAHGLIGLVDQNQWLCIEGNDLGPGIIEICHAALSCSCLLVCAGLAYP